MKVKKYPKPKSVMMWAGISGLGKTKFVFVPKGVKINAKTYQELIFEGTTISWDEKKAKNINWWLQQVWVLTHGAKKTMEWCEDNLLEFWTKDVWPSNSYDLNHMDFVV